MKQRTRIYYSEAQKALMWDRWEQGESLHSIARLFDRHHPSIAGILSRTGGYALPKENVQVKRWPCQKEKRFPEASPHSYQCVRLRVS